jgi:hypothetical protein
VLSDNTFSFSIDVARDPQSDDFHGLWEDLGSGKVLNISGKGSGVVRGSEVTGTFDGLFALYDPLDPPQPGIFFTAHYCKARDQPVPVCEAVGRRLKEEAVQRTREK